jgi:hypothetical protein
MGQGRAGFAAAHCEKLGKICLLTLSAKSRINAVAMDESEKQFSFPRVALSKNNKSN